MFSFLVVQTRLTCFQIPGKNAPFENTLNTMKLHVVLLTAVYAMTMAEKAWLTVPSASGFPKEAEKQSIEYIASM
jgi:hypothetical protein